MAAGTVILQNLGISGVGFDFSGLDRKPAAVAESTKIISVLGKISNFVGLDCTVTFRSAAVRSKVEAVLDPIKSKLKAR
jgi:hypothetical protein